MDDERTPNEPRPSAHLREEASAEAQEQAALEQSIERIQDEVDAAALETASPEPEDALDLPSQERLFDQATVRAPRA
jgi:hypothetical protein